EPWMTEPAFRDAPLDLREREQVEEAPLLVAPDEEGFLLPVLTEEALGFYGRDATLEGAATSRCRRNRYRSRPSRSRRRCPSRRCRPRSPTRRCRLRPPRTTPPRSSHREFLRPEAWCLARSLRLLGR